MEIAGSGTNSTDTVIAARRATVPHGVLQRLMARPLVVDGGIAFVLSVMAQLQAGWAMSLAGRGLLLLVTASVTFRRRAPLATALAIAVLVSLMALTPNPPSVFGEYLAIMLAAYTVAERCSLVPAVLGGLALTAGITVHDLASNEFDSVGGIVSDLVVPVLLWILGRIVRFQAARASRSETLVGALERDREELAIAAVAQERARLARELHDVVTHTVSVVVIQAQGAQRALGDGYPDVATALGDIEHAGRAALADMRRLLGLLRDDADRAGHAPQPGLTDLPELIGRVRTTGLDVAFTGVTVSSGVDPGVALSVYRIVQEALTNAVKYAPAAHVNVQVTAVGDAIEVTVTDDGPGHAVSTGTGRGLLGMRERVAVYGGTLVSGPHPGGGFAVHARLPLEVSQL